MYDELAKRLREKAGAIDYDGRPDIACDYEQAADAIEELSRENGSLAKSVNEASEILRKRWIPVTERLPEDGQIVLCYWYNIHCSKRDNYTVMRFRKGRTAEQLVGVKSYNSSDQWENNLRPYCWDDPHGPLSLFGQDVSHWMPLPEPPKEEIE